MPFQIVRVELTEREEVIARKPLQPIFELRDDAMALAEFDASRNHDEYDYDAERDCWWGQDRCGRTVRFVVEPSDASAIAA
jgi:hypothetical protein